MGRRPISAIVPPAPSENTYRPSLSAPRSTICAEDVNRASVDYKRLAESLRRVDATLIKKRGWGLPRSIVAELVQAKELTKPQSLELACVMAREESRITSSGFIFCCTVFHSRFSSPALIPSM